MTEIKLSITIDGEEVFGTNGFEWLMCGNDHKEIVLSALSESMVMICGCLPKPGADEPIISVRRGKPATVINLVPKS